MAWTNTAPASAHFGVKPSIQAGSLRVPCLTLREETEWVETVQAGWNRLVGVDPVQVLGAWTSMSPPTEHPPIYGDGTAAKRILGILDTQFGAGSLARGTEAEASGEAVEAPEGGVLP